MVSVSVSVPRAQLQRLDALSTTLYRLAGADQRVILEDVGMYLHRVFATRFIAESGRFGKWPRLAKRTRQDRTRFGYGGEHPILRRKGALLRATAPTVFGENKYWRGTSYRGTPVKSIWNLRTEGGVVGGARAKSGIKQHALTVGVEGEHVRRLQFGGRGAPPRPFIYITKRNQTEINSMFRQWVTSRIQHAADVFRNRPRGIGRVR